MPKARRTQRSTGGKKLYAIRDGRGRFEDVQTYERAHGSDVRRRSKAEAGKGRKKAARGRTATKKR